MTRRPVPRSRPSARLVGAGILLAALSGPAPAAAPAAGPVPKLVVANARHEAGTVAQGQLIEAVFELANAGTGDLVVSDVRPGCGCTVAEFDKVVKPGARGRVLLKVETRGFNGPITKSALILSNDPMSPQTTLLVAAVVKPYVEILPTGYLRLQGIVGETTTATTILASAEPDFAPTGAQPTLPALTASVAPVPEKERLPGKPDRQFRVTLSTTPETAEGLVGGYVKVVTGSKRQPEVDVPVSGFLRPTVSLSGGSINFQNFEPASQTADPVRREVVLTSNNPKNPAFAVTKAEVTVAGIYVEVLPLDNTRVRVVLTADPKMRKGTFEGTLVVRTNDPIRGEIKLPVRGTVL